MRAEAFVGKTSMLLTMFCIKVGAGHSNLNSLTCFSSVLHSFCLYLILSNTFPGICNFIALEMLFWVILGFISFALGQTIRVSYNPVLVQRLAVRNELCTSLTNLTVEHKEGDSHPSTHSWNEISAHSNTSNPKTLRYVWPSLAFDRFQVSFFTHDRSVYCTSGWEIHNLHGMHHRGHLTITIDYNESMDLFHEHGLHFKIQSKSAMGLSSTSERKLKCFKKSSTPTDVPNTPIRDQYDISLNYWDKAFAQAFGLVFIKYAVDQNLGSTFNLYPVFGKPEECK